VRTLKGVTFVNDSKATNPASTIWALRNITTPTILLAGGRDKGLDYSAVIPYLRKVRKINLFGESALKIQQALNGHAEFELCSDLHEAVQRSYQQAQSGDTVLLSPMCASFDMFSNYEQRGAKFIEFVNAL
jgi:UDP-N-acetylmuramoylalanine--D-glutamate ligase